MSTLIETQSVRRPAKAGAEAFSYDRPGAHARVRGALLIREKELPIFTRELSAMLLAGVMLAEALRTIEEQVSSRAFRRVVGHVRVDVEHGMRLTVAMARFPGVFDLTYRSMLQTGEVSGAMPETLDRLAEYLESAADLRRKAKAAMMYPAVVTLIAGGLFLCVTLWLVPAFERIYDDLGGTLPGPTRALIALSRGLRRYAPVVLGSLALLVFGLRRYFRTERGAYIRDTMLMRMPVLGVLIRKIALARFSEALSHMLGSGISVLTALDLGRHAAGNQVIARATLEVRNAVERGHTLGEAMKKHGCFSGLLVKMVSVGERAGKADEMLSRAAQFYKSEVAALLSGLTAMIEPLLIVVLGAVVGGMVLCIFLPIFKMHELVKF